MMNQNSLLLLGQAWAKTWPGLVIPQKNRLLYNGRGEVRSEAS